MDYSHIRKPDLGYPYQFGTDELDAAQACVKRTALPSSRTC